MPDKKKRVNYYPFGLQHKGYNNVVNGVHHPYGFNGKEEQNELGLGWIDLGARQMDPAIGRFMTIDPLADFVNYQSPYVIADNNPILYIDVHGLGILNVIGNLWKKLKRGVKKLIKPYSCDPHGIENIGKAWERADFPGVNRFINKTIKKIGKALKPEKSSSPSNSTSDSESRSPVSGIGGSPIGISPFNTITNFEGLNLNNPETPEPRRRKKITAININGISIQAGRYSLTNLISFGSGSGDGFGGITRATTAIPRTANNVANLDQIAQALLLNPGSTVFLKLVLPNFTTSRGARDAATYNKNRFQQFARELRNRGVSVNSIQYINVPVTGRPHNINVIDLNIR
ncbi:MAG: RHS repeat-associated protein [Ulvibacter sp.]